jgi:host factor-I protein
METKPAAQNMGYVPQQRSQRAEQHHHYLMSGVNLTGRIRSFDKYSVVLETNNQEQLIFKHAISTVAVAKAGHSYAERPRMVTATPTADAAEASEAPVASGTEG